MKMIRTDLLEIAYLDGGPKDGKPLLLLHGWPESPVGFEEISTRFQAAGFRTVYAKLKKLKDLHKQALREIEEFFVNYHRLQGKKYKLIGCRGEKTALKLIAKARKRL
jgi:hypothetical protein